MDNTLNSAKSAVTQSLALDLIDNSGTATPMQAALSYDPRDPYAVSAVFMTGAGNVRWTFGRDLLLAGIYEPCGDGDVHVWPCLDADGHAVVIVELCSPDGEALVQAKSGDLTNFVERMTKAVEPGTESALTDVDGAITAILAADLA